jgi:hypothetical protein
MHAGLPCNSSLAHSCSMLPGSRARSHFSEAGRGQSTRSHVECCLPMVCADDCGHHHHHLTRVMSARGEVSEAGDCHSTRPAPSFIHANGPRSQVQKASNAVCRTPSRALLTHWRCLVLLHLGCQGWQRGPLQCHCLVLLQCVRGLTLYVVAAVEDV